MTPAVLPELLDRAVPGCRLRSCELLAGGANNLNYKIRCDGIEDALVVRIYVRDALAWAKEMALLRAAAGIAPVVEVLYAEQTYLIYRYAEGMTFQELKSMRNPEDMAQAAYAIGAALAKLQRVPVVDAVAPRGEMGWDFDSPLLLDRIGGRNQDRWCAFAAKWMPRVVSLAQDDRRLVHGDFNNRNTIVRKDGGRWIVSAILDWEYAFAGSPLWDAARFICYENPARPYREPNFSNGYRDGGGKLPEDWTELSRALNTLSGVQSLTRPDLPQRFVPELCELVAASLEAAPFK